MPYSHFHNWSFHTHHRRPKGGNHYNAVRRRQKPWRIGVWVLIIGLLIGSGAVLVPKYDLLPRDAPVADLRVEEGRPGMQANEATQAVEPQMRERANTATRTVETRMREQTRTAEAKVEAVAHVSEVERKVHTAINAQRLSNGAAPLTWDDRLGSVARAHSEDMTGRGYFDHDTPEGLDPTDRLHRAGHRCRKGTHVGIAENITIAFADDDSEQMASEAVQSWMTSPGHRQNLLGRRYTTTGVGASLGKWQGYKAVYLTQVFC